MSAVSRGAQRVRREGAVVSGLGWALAFLVIPLLHTLGHRADHTHFGEAVVFAAAGQSHGHPHHHGPKPRSAEPAYRGPLTPSLEHQGAGLAHLGASLTQAARVPSPVAGALVARLAPLPPASRIVGAAVFEAHRSRAPPARSALLS